MTDIVEPVVDRYKVKKIAKLLGQALGAQVKSYIWERIIPRSVQFYVAIHII